MANNYDGETFLNKVYKELYNSPEVLQGYKNPSQKEKNIQEYMERLERLHKRVLDSPRENDLNLLKHFYYDKYVIKECDIPDSYYNHQAEIALERGYGHINITESMKKEMAKQVIEEQKKSLDYWLEYFLSEDSKMYPTWAKYWAFQGMLKLGSFDKSSHEFNRRTKGTTSPFIELNHEALSLSIDTLLKYINKETIEDKELEKLIEKGVFGKIYAYEITLLDKIKKQESNTNDGIWIKYPQGSDHMKLVKTLEGKGTGWCTAGESIAKKQLEKGDFYVYYSYDSKGNPSIPRIAIRMEGNSIGEVRGIAEKQNLESDMESIADKKLQEFPDYPKYQEKVNDMKKLTKIYKEYKTRELTVAELRFLYEIDKKIVGFGYGNDPRIREILNNRKIKNDLSKVFHCSREEIGTNIDDFYNKKLICYYGDLDLSNLTNTKELILPETIIGDLDLGHLISAEILILPKTMNGDLNLSILDGAEVLVLPEKINGGLYLNHLTSAEGLILPEVINGNLNLSGLISIKELVLPKTINGYLDLRNLTSAKGLVLPETINGDLFLNSLTSAEELILPKIINGTLHLDKLTTAEGLELPETIKGGLFLFSLTSAKGLVLPETLNGDLFLNSLTSAEGLMLPKTLNGGLVLSSLTSAKGLVLPETLNGGLELSGLISAEGLILPKTINRELYLNSLTSLDGLILPNSFKCWYIKTSFNRIYPENFYKYQKEIVEEEVNRKNNPLVN